MEKLLELKNWRKFWRKNILVDSTRSLDCIAKCDCVWYSVSTSILKCMLGINFRSLLYLNLLKVLLIEVKFNIHLLDKIKDLFRSIH